jgi:hypothetical protein
LAGNIRHMGILSNEGRYLRAVSMFPTKYSINTVE